jgi:serine/threonine protein kinase
MSEDNIPKLKNYSLWEKIGSGGMGTVYKGEDNVGRSVAVKVIHPELSNRQDLRARFLNEARTMGQLGSHPNIVFMYGMSEEDDGTLYIVMEYVNGEDIDNKIKTRGLIPAEAALPIFWQVLQALSFAHGKGIIHRDIKPSNVLVSDSGQVQVMDFGIAFVRGGERLTVDSVPGTPEYMAPELFQEDNKGADELSDIYALGVTLYEMMTARVPFESKATTTMAAFVNIAKRHQEELPPSPSTIYEFIDEEIEQIILKALNKNPKERYQNVNEFMHAVEQQAHRVGINLPSSAIADNAARSTPLPDARRKELEHSSINSVEIDQVEHDEEVPIWLSAVVWSVIAGVGFVIGNQLI